MNAPTWDLETLFAGGITGDAFSGALNEVEADARDLVGRADALDVPPGGDWVEVLLDLETIAVRAHQISTFTHCCTCQDARDKDAAFASGRVEAVYGKLSRAWVPIEAHIVSCDDAAFAALIAEPSLAEMTPRLERMRQKAPLLLPRAQQALATELAQDGIHAWGRLYDHINGSLQVTLPDGRVIGSAQAQNMLGSAERPERTAGLDSLDAAWNAVDEDCARILTHIVGTRQTLNDRRGVDELGPQSPPAIGRRSASGGRSCCRRRW